MTASAQNDRHQQASDQKLFLVLWLGTSYCNKGGSKISVLHLCLRKFLLTSRNYWKAGTAPVPAQGENCGTVAASEGTQNPPGDRIPHDSPDCTDKSPCSIHAQFTTSATGAVCYILSFPLSHFLCKWKVLLHKLSPALREKLHRTIELLKTLFGTT